MKANSLSRFLEAQETMYAMALSEIKKGRKRTHWMWYIYPQLRGLGMSDVAHFYGIMDLAEAREYLSHPILGTRLYEITSALLPLDATDPVTVFGKIDALKLCSSMTLFAHATENNALFLQVLDKFYGGQQDAATLKMLEL